jgi:hypothetical protein
VKGDTPLLFRPSGAGQDAAAYRNEVTAIGQVNESGIGQPRRARVDRKALLQAWLQYRLARRSEASALEALKISDGDRVAVQKINDEHRLKPGALLGRTAEEISALLGADEAARRAAIEGVLGRNVATELFAAESLPKREEVEVDGGVPQVPEAESGMPSPEQPTNQAGASPRAAGTAPDQASPPATPPPEVSVLDAGS